MLVKNRNNNSKTPERKTPETSTAIVNPQQLKIKE